ncbi:MAG: class I SAM-dependent methyltransferase, partial [Oscillospiraceae bacterium]|nr:class I SAM-dependent methyltransferase [Oscillospiraceae bacterium]
FKDIISYSGAAKGKRALEIGTGTGKATTPFLDAGFNVTAVELGENMAEFLKKKFNEYKGFNVIMTDFENVLLKDDSYDLIYAATAFHWVDPQIGCPKAFSLLKDGGVFALFRYNMIPHVGEPAYEAIQAVYEKHYYSYYKTNKRPVKKSYDDFRKPSEILHGFGFEDLKNYGFSDISMNFYDVTKIYDTDEFITLRDTMSDHRALPDTNRTALYAGFKKVMERYGGQYKEDYVFQLYMGRKPQVKNGTF